MEICLGNLSGILLETKNTGSKKKLFEKTK